LIRQSLRWLQRSRKRANASFNSVRRSDTLISGFHPLNFITVFHPACIGIRTQWSIETVYRRAYTVYSGKFSRAVYQAKPINAINLYFHVVVSYIFLAGSIALAWLLTVSFNPAFLMLLILTMTGDFALNWMPLRTLVREQRALIWRARKTGV
jgi:hypothetical protein